MLEEWQATTLDTDESAPQPVSLPGRPVSVAGADTVKYTTSFADPREPSDDVAVLELRGLYAHSEVEVTGDRLDGDGPVEHDTYFRPLRIPFEPDEDNKVTVTCHAPQDRFGGLHDTDMVPDSFAVPSIWWGVSLESYSLPYIESVDIQPELTEDSAVLHLRTTVVADEIIDERITYSLRPAGDHQSRGMMERASVETDGPGKTVVEHTINVHDPALWWPRELGRQNLYELRAKLNDVEHSVKTGICTIGFEEGKLRVNNEPVPIRGVNLLTDDEADLTRALDCNANLIRAHAHALPDRLYERCNEEGILVWQDLPLTGPGAFDLDRATAIADALANQYGRHPSLAAYGVHDDPVESFPDGVGSGLLDGLRFRWRAWRSEYDRKPAETIAETLPEQRPAFPVTGAPGVDNDAASYYPGWDYGRAEDMQTLLQRYPAEVVAEFGAGALAEEREDGVDDVAGFEAAKHDARVSGGLEESQHYQATLLRTIIEQLRMERVGAIAFALRDTDLAGKGVYGQDGSRKAAADALERAYEPLQAFLADPTTGESEVVVINDTPHGRSAQLHWEIGETEGSTDLTVGPYGRWSDGPVEIPKTAQAATLTLDGDDFSVTNEYSRPE